MPLRRSADRCGCRRQNQLDGDPFEAQRNASQVDEPISSFSSPSLVSRLTFDRRQIAGDWSSGNHQPALTHRTPRARLSVTSARIRVHGQLSGGIVANVIRKHSSCECPSSRE